MKRHEKYDFYEDGLTHVERTGKVNTLRPLSWYAQKPQHTASHDNLDGNPDTVSVYDNDTDYLKDAHLYPPPSNNDDYYYS